MFRGVILLVDRFANMNALISSYLTASGFEVRSLRSPEELSADILTDVHVVLMDIDTAGSRLSEACSLLSGLGIPLLVLTSENDSSGRLTALEMGAADVMSRPLDMAELTARVRSAQSRSMVTSPFVDRPTVSVGGLTADIVHYKVFLDGEELEMPPKEVALLYLLLSAPGRVFTRGELARQLGSAGTERGVNIQISRLRKRIGRYSGNIASVRGVGYKFVE